MTSDMNPLKIATQHFFFKPMCGHIYSFALRAYDNAGCRLVSPVLDVGCNDGTFGVLLSRMLGQSLPIVGVDLDSAKLTIAKAKNFNHYTTLMHADATNLPFADNSFSTIFSNFVFSGIPDLHAAFQEMKRVLTADGKFYCTVRTNLFSESYMISRLLRRLGCDRAAKLHAERIDRRSRSINVSFPPSKWTDIFTKEGLRVSNVVGFYPLKVIPMWSLLSCTPMRVFGFLKLLPLRSAKRLSTYLQRRIFTHQYLNTSIDEDPEECMAILICASK